MYMGVLVSLQWQCIPANARQEDVVHLHRRYSTGSKHFLEQVTSQKHPRHIHVICNERSST